MCSITFCSVGFVIQLLANGEVQLMRHWLYKSVPRHSILGFRVDLKNVSWCQKNVFLSYKIFLFLSQYFFLGTIFFLTAMNKFSEEKNSWGKNMFYHYIKRIFSRHQKPFLWEYRPYVDLVTSTADFHYEHLEALIFTNVDGNKALKTIS